MQQNMIGAFISWYGLLLLGKIDDTSYYLLLLEASVRII